MTRTSSASREAPAMGHARTLTIILKATRVDLDFSQEKLAGILGWTRNMVANLESGRRTLTFVDFVMIAKAFGIDPEKMLRRILSW